ncbi:MULTISPECIES: DUF1343 domain-containing protein [unclassified Treponema]|uniref:DUF1343 domain-containing protein n=1 Tax=unclassified Treponema TaxID=2638727 RepID=UPI0020A48E01|nr:MULTISPECIES: DUF1343 domain-containing protein [unclassified Treponema]UTC67684.1 DUF1343 domain-containing protein [Treponema sp. OMZ 789]UTC70412.1 DUF1343 domain-containing protein [Treponema sp. OMZ 790]
MKKKIFLFCFLSFAVITFAKERMSKPEFKIGIERVDEFLNLFNGKKIGLITNQTGMDSLGRSSIEILYEKTNLKALFSPEHGIRGNAREGTGIANTVDKKTGLTVYSLYGKTKRPTKEMLKEIDVLCFDIQDVGARFYTYIYTMAYAMEACARDGKTFIVFDRPNPINGINVEGNILEEEYKSFTGYFPIVQRHGMTVGELALMFNEEFKIGCDLKIIPMQSWKREDYFEDLNLMWIPPSPNIPTPDTALVYSGFCIFEGVNISVGRGTTMPFKYIGAPYIDAEALAETLNALNLAGVFFKPAYFTPSLSLYKDELCEGVQIIVKAKAKFSPVKSATAVMYKIRDMYPDKFKINNYPAKRCGLNLLTGTDKLSTMSLSLNAYFKFIENGEKKFLKKRKRYLMY